MQIDATKKLLIDEIMRKSNQELNFWEDDLLGDENELERAQRIAQSKNQTYFAKL